MWFLRIYFLKRCSQIPLIISLPQSLLSTLESVSIDGIREPETEVAPSLPASSPLLVRWAGIKANGEESMSLLAWIQAGQKGESHKYNKFLIS